MYIVYLLCYYLIQGKALSDIIYWIMLFFAPFSLLDCFSKISTFHLFPEGATSNFYNEINALRKFAVPQFFYRFRCFSLRIERSW